MASSYEESLSPNSKWGATTVPIIYEDSLTERVVLFDLSGCKYGKGIHLSHCRKIAYRIGDHAAEI